MDFENEEPLARNEDPATSHIAGDKLTSSGKRTSYKFQILGWLQDNAIDTVEASLTSREMAAASSIPHERCHKRLADLERDGFVVKGRQRICRISGELAWTWMLRRHPGLEQVMAVPGPAQRSLFEE